MIIEQSAVERDGRERPAGKRRARTIGKIIRMPRIRREFHLTAPFEVVDHLGRALQIDLAPIVGCRSDHRVEIFSGFGDAVGETGSLCLARPRHPDGAGGSGAGAPDLPRFLAEQNT